MKKIYAAHISKDGKIQSVREHSEKTAEKAASFSVKELAPICEAAGMLHDIGKYQPSFDRRIHGENISIEHSICGAIESVSIYGKTFEGYMAALCVAGHHTGLPDFGTRFDSPNEPTLKGRLKREPEDYSAYREELVPPEIDRNLLRPLVLGACRTKEEATEAYAFLTRYCFSCLVDADTLDTIQANGESVPPPLTADFASCLTLTDERLRSFTPKTELQKARARVQAQAFANIRKDSDIYLMEMPTGSGKTLASMKCALELAVRENKKRIIYVIPYNSIIDQTVDEFEKLFGSRAQILRHQSSFSYDDTENISEDYRKSASYGCENWDAQIIVTTAVQFFESVYSSKRGRARKIHNIADSVIVFDEAHLMPVEYLQPCLRAVAFSTKYLHSKAMFLTATMPDYKNLLGRYGLGTVTVTDLVPSRCDFKYFSKNTYVYLGETSATGLLKKAGSFSSSLIVVNSRKKARRIFDSCGGRKFHLSKYMTGNNIISTVIEIKEALRDIRERYPDLKGVPEDERIVVVSTSLIQAGVDLDFEAAFREMSGLDDILQTGGRANREGLQETGYVFIFESGGCRTERISSGITRGIIKEFDDISSKEAVAAYYERLFKANADMIVKNSLSNECCGWENINFRSYDLKMIKNIDVSVVAITDDKIRRIVEEGKHTGYISERKVQGYCFSVKPSELEDLIKQHVIETVGNTYILTDTGCYDRREGIRFSGRDATLVKKRREAVCTGSM